MTDTAHAAEATIALQLAMVHALALARRGPASGLNPQVGCVILAASAGGDSSVGSKNAVGSDSAVGEIIAEGWHRGAGTVHAEVDALSKLTPEQTRGATAVVTLEPCNHTGHTGPCSDALLAAGIAHVVYAVADPGVLSGGGAAKLTAAGVTVTGGLLADVASEAMRVWLTATREGRPFVTVKWASSLDGRAAAADGSSQWITGAAARQRVHEQRAAADAILVGTGTVLADDPSLTARTIATAGASDSDSDSDSEAPGGPVGRVGLGGDFGGVLGGGLMSHQPIPVVLGERAIAATAQVFSHPRGVIVIASRDLDAALAELFARGIRHLFVEGGPTVASAFIAAGFADQLLIYLAPTLLGGPKLALGDLGVGSIGAARRLHIDSFEQLGEDFLITARPISIPPLTPTPNTESR